jgi:ferrous iron transport protein B
VVLASASHGEGTDAVQRFLQLGCVATNTIELPVLQDVRACAEWACDVGRRSSYQPPLPSAWTRRLDGFVLHPIFGPLIFAAVVVAVFQGMFRVAQPLADGLQWVLQTAGAKLAVWIPAGWLQSLLLNGIWKGVGSVIIFLPQIMVLFLLIGILEDSGYLARAAVIADRTMARIGLNGKAFIPLLSAYGCAVPAIMATRTIENRRDRIATILIAPFMTCSARLPVYTMIIAAFVPERPLAGVFLGTRAAALLGLYALGFLAAMGTARLLKSSILRSEGHPFILELPSYRWPTARGLGLRLFERGQAFLVRAGTVILAVSIVLWVLTYLPMKNGEPPALADSVIARAGQAIQPAIAPLGFDWKIGVGLLTSVAAREVIVSTLGALNGVDPAAHNLSFQDALRAEMTPGAAAALLIFFAFAMQCTSTLAMVRRETNSWRWPALQFCYMTSLAYVSAFLANRVVTLWLA